MVLVTPSLWVVFKRTGGRAWNKKWGLPRLSRTQKENRVKQRKEEQGIRALLKEAAERDPLKFEGTILSSSPICLIRKNRRIGDDWSITLDWTV